MKLGRACLGLALFLTPVACGGGSAGADDSTVSVEAPRVPVFEDLTESAGIDFVHFNAASQNRYLPETMGSGVAVFDFDNDDLPDLYFLNGASLSDDLPLRSGSGRLYRNLGGGRFQDVTRGSGLDVVFYGMGAAVGDYDNDGYDDLLVTAVDRVRLFRNLGGGRFEEVTARVGLDCEGYSSGAAWVDYDRDGFLDLIVGRYVEWSPETDVACSLDRLHRTYCTPEVYPAVSNALFRNLGGSRFVDVSEEAGIASHIGKALGVAILDYDQDHWPDIAIANDTTGNFLFVNQQDGTFAELGIDAGIAYGESGAARGGMGIDTADVDADGFLDIVIGNFSHEMVAYYRGSNSGYFIDDAAPAGLGLPTLMTLAFGTLIEDLDNNGWLDLFFANGHIEPDIARFQRAQTYLQPPQLFLGYGGERFFLVEGDGELSTALVARGLAAGDLDRDGRLDLVLTQNGGAPRILRNLGSTGNWVEIDPVGRMSNRTGYGVRARVVSGDHSWTRWLHSGRSYLSASDPILHFGLGEVDQIDLIELLWPSGENQQIENPPLNRRLRVTEGSDWEVVPDRLG